MPTFKLSIINCQLSIVFVRLTGLEPAHREILDPKSSASTNSATGASLLGAFFRLRVQRYEKK